MHVIGKCSYFSTETNDLLDALLEYGADPKICNNMNESIIDYLILLSITKETVIHYIPRFVQLGVPRQRKLTWKIEYIDTFDFLIIFAIPLKIKRAMRQVWLPRDLWTLLKKYLH